MSIIYADLKLLKEPKLVFELRLLGIFCLWALPLSLTLYASVSRKRALVFMSHVAGLKSTKAALEAQVEDQLSRMQPNVNKVECDEAECPWISQRSWDFTVPSLSVVGSWFSGQPKHVTSAYFLTTAST